MINNHLDKVNFQKMHYNSNKALKIFRNKSNERNTRESYLTLTRDIKKSYVTYIKLTRKKTRYMKMMILPKSFYKFNALLIQILKEHFT